jgi:hypothetical protein
VIHSNCCLTIYKVAEEARILKSICQEILTENLGMHHVASQPVPCHLSEDQKQNHFDVIAVFWWYYSKDSQ